LAGKVLPFIPRTSAACLSPRMSGSSRRIILR
jgi:hypothetical protein